MNRCIEPDRVFEALEDPAASREFEEHLAGCARCREILGRRLALRDAVRDIMDPGEPDWTRIDRSVEGAIRDLAARPRESSRWIPAALSAAAAVLIALALFRSAGGEENAPPIPLEPPALVGAGDNVKTSPPFVETTVAAAIDLREGPGEPGPVRDGESWITGDRGEVLLAIGEAASLASGPETSFSVPSTLVEAYTVRLERGKLTLELPPGSVERDLLVMSAGEVFAIFEGSAEFERNAVGISVAITSGEVIAFGDTGSRILGAGRRFTRSGGRWVETPTGFARLERMDIPPPVGVDADMMESPERPAHSMGTLPLPVVRQAIEASRPGLTRCYEASLKRYPSLRNEVSIQARIGVSSKGSVSRVRINGVSEWPVLEECLEDVLLDMSFPRPSGGPLELIFPFRLSPLR